MKEHPPRKLAVILHADVVDSTTLVHRNETLAHRRIQDVFHRFSETIESYGGVPHELRGDALVAEFYRASDAVAASLVFQVENTKFNSTLGDDIQPHLRMGIAMGEVVIADKTITGDGVVLAQRLEQLAKSGGVCIQGAAHETVPQRLPFAYESLGEQEVKGFDEPVRAYAVTLKRGQTTPAPERHERRSRKWFAVAAIGLLIIIGGGLAWFQPWVPREEPASIERMVFPLPDKPSIAVLSFTNMSGDPEQEYFADGISEDLTTDLSKISGLFVIARNSAFSYKGRNVKVQQVAEELGVRYVLEGSVRRVGDTVRVNAQLIDTMTGGHLWAERYDGSLANMFTLQDRVTRDVVGALSISLTEDEHAALSREGTVDPRALDALLRGWSYYWRNSPEDYAKAIAHLEDALTIDPDYERAHAALAAVYQSALNRGFTAGLGEWSRTLGIRPDDILKKVKTHLEQTRASPTPLVHRVTSQLLSFQGRFDDALREAEMAIALDANDPVGYEAMAAALILGGRPAEGAEHIRKAIRLDPRYPGEYLFWFGLAEFGQGRFERAAEALERAASIDLGDARPLIVLASAYGHLGRTDEARATVEKLNELRSAREERRKRAPEGDVRVGIDVFLLGPYTLVDVNMWPFKEVVDRERLREGLRLAGVPKTGPDAAESPIEVDGATTVDVAEAKALYDRSVLFIDVRSLVDWNFGHIPEAAHLELQKVFSEAALLKLVAKDGEVVIHCEGPKCLRSSRACAKAAAWGFTHVYYFRDGFPAWRAAGYPVAVVSE